MLWLGVEIRIALRAEGKIIARESYSAMKLQAMVSTIPPVYPLGAGSFNLVHL
jgi:hypothetical protein